MANRFSVVLVRPEIPHNTGAIGRLCVGLGVPLHLVRPLGFHLDDRSIARAGLDYWPHLDVSIHDTWDEYMDTVKVREHCVRLVMLWRKEYEKMDAVCIIDTALCCITHRMRA